MIYLGQDPVGVNSVHSLVIDDNAGNGDTGMTWSADKLTAEFEGKLDASEKGAANGVAGLDVNGKIPSSQLPSYVDDVVEYANLAGFPQTGESGKIYVALDTNKTYRWSGSSYVEISQSLALGETSTTAYRGDRGAAAYAAAVTNVENSPTEDSNNLITSGAVYEGLAAKMDFDPEYGREVAGVANKLLSDKYTEDNTPYLMRKAPDAEFDEETLVGGTVCWNQQIANGNFENTIGWSGQNSTKSANNNIISCTLTSVYSSNPLYRDYTSATVGHKYLATCDVYSPKATSARWQYSSVATGISIVSIPANTWKNVSNIFSQTDVSLFLLYYCIDPCSLEVGDTVQFRNYMVFDLTQMFGSTIADYIYTLEQNTVGAGVAFFRNLFPKAYYAYDPGSLQSVQAGSRVIGGFNLLKTQPTNPNNYAAITFNENAVTKVKAGYEYQYSFDISNATSWGTALIIWDLNGNRLEESTADVNAQKAFSTKDAAFYAFNGGTANPVYYVQSANNTAQNMYFTFNQDCYVMFYYGFGDTSASTIVSNVCLNLKGEGNYEPYREPVSYPFDTSLTLRGLPKLDNGRLHYDGDEYKADGTVTRRYGIVDLGTLNWHVDNDLPSGYKRFYAILPTNALPTKSDTTNGVRTICSKYTVLEQSGTYPATNTGYTVTVDSINNAVIYIYDEAYKSSATETFTTAMSGVYLVYELATSTTESAAPFTPMQEVFPNGTEQFTEWGTRDVEIPVGHKSKYSNNHKTEIDKDIDTLYNNKADAIFKSVSDAAIANFTDGADGMPVKSMVVDINPVQDLHGQSSPWPAGGNVNQFGVDTVTPATGSTCYGLTVVTDTTNGTISLSGTPSWTVGGNKQFRLFYQNNSYSKSLKAKYFVVSKSANVTSVYEYPLSADNTDALAININVTDNNELSLVVKPVVYLGNTAPSAWTPTSNICPITGWTGAKVKNCGGVVHDIPDKVLTSNGITGNMSSHVLTASGTASATFDKYLDSAGIPSGTYIMSGFQNLTGLNAEWYVYNATDYSRIKSSKNPEGDSVTIPSGKECRVGLLVHSGETVNIKCTPCLTTKVDTYEITWQSKAGTVYGGTVDPVNGVLTVTKKSVDLGSLTWTYDPNNAYFYGAVSGIFVPATNADRLKGIQSSMYPVSTQFSINSTSPDNKSMLTANGSVFIRDSSYSDKDVFKTAMSGVQLVYELATPITYKLDPATITTLLGTNNIFADTGNVSLAYPCDTKAYIDQNEGVKDVQVNGTTVVTNGVANIPISGDSLGVVKPAGMGVNVSSQGFLSLAMATDEQIKAGTHNFSAIEPINQHKSVFYGLAKAAGDTTMPSSSNPVGEYTSAALDKIQQMLGLWTPKFYLKYTLDEDRNNIPSDSLPFGDVELNIYEELVVSVYQSDTTQTAFASNDFVYLTVRDALNNGYINVSGLYFKGTKRCSVMRIKRLPCAVTAELINDGSCYTNAFSRSLDYVDKIRWLALSAANGTVKAGTTLEAYIHRFI